jgi:hypothetical protein
MHDPQILLNNHLLGILDHPLSRMMTVEVVRPGDVVIASASEAIHRAAKQKAGLLRRKCSSQ